MDSVPENGKLMCADHNLYMIPESLYKYSSQVTTLDLSYNNIRDVEGLQIFAPNLKELILDCNEIDDTLTLPNLPTLTLLSICNNKVCDLYRFLDILADKAQNLEFLSLMGNPACPDSLSDRDCDEDDYKRYRLYVCYKFPRLKFLDSRRVTKVEKQEAKLKGPYLRVVKPLSDASSTEPSSPDEPAFHPLPSSQKSSENPHKGTFKRTHYNYHGKHSEGNRFIRDRHL